MFKKIAIVLLSLNLLTPKPVVAEPVTIVVGVVVGGFVGWWYGSSGTAAAETAKTQAEAAKNKAESERTAALHAKARVDSENIQKENEIRKLRAELDERIRQAQENYKTCLRENKHNYDLGSARIAHHCEDLEKELQAFQNPRK